CHPLPLSKVEIEINPEHALPGFLVQATVKVTAKTGVEMEALTAVSIACLTVYDMVKALERGVHIEGIRLLLKSGGKSGEWRAEAYSIGSQVGGRGFAARAGGCETAAEGSCAPRRRARSRSD